MVEKQYTVREGDSLYQISKNLGTVPEGIYILNHLKSDRLEIGQKLWIPSYVEAQVLYEDTPVYRWESAEGEILGELDAGCRLEVVWTTQEFLAVRYLRQKGYLRRQDAPDDCLWSAAACDRSPGILHGRGTGRLSFFRGSV